MALFKILSGNSDNFNTDVNSESVSPAFNEGYCYFIKDNQKLYVDWLDGEERKRTALTSEKLVIELNDDNVNTSASNDNIIFFNVKNIQTLIKEANNKKIPIELNYYDLFSFNSLKFCFSYNNIDIYLTDTIFDAALTHQFITFYVWVQDDFLEISANNVLFNAMAETSEKGKIAVYGKDYIEGKDLWYTVDLIGENGIFTCDNTTINNFITNDNVDFIKVSLELNENAVKNLTAKERFGQRKAFQKANFTTSIDTSGITITDSNQELKYLKVSLLVDNFPE